MSDAAAGAAALPGEKAKKQQRAPKLKVSKEERDRLAREKSAQIFAALSAEPSATVSKDAPAAVDLTDPAAGVGNLPVPRLPAGSVETPASLNAKKKREREEDKKKFVEYVPKTKAHDGGEKPKRKKPDSSGEPTGKTFQEATGTRLTRLSSAIEAEMLRKDPMYRYKFASGAAVLAAAAAYAYAPKIMASFFV